jgi:hypothetical protein
MTVRLAPGLTWCPTPSSLEVRGEFRGDSRILELTPHLSPQKSTLLYCNRRVEVNRGGTRMTWGLGEFLKPLAHTLGGISHI